MGKFDPENMQRNINKNYHYNLVNIKIIFYKYFFTLRVS